MMKRILWLVLLPLAAIAQGCSTYSYFDVDLKLGDGFTNVVQTGMITECHMFVSGATTEDFRVGMGDSGDMARCLNAVALASTKDLGKMRYSTFADSGDVTFTLRLFQNMPTDACELGHGSTTLAIESGKTVAGTLTVPLTGPGCH